MALGEQVARADVEEEACEEREDECEGGLGESEEQSGDDAHQWRDGSQA